MKSTVVPIFTTWSSHCRRLSGWYDFLFLNRWWLFPVAFLSFIFQEKRNQVLPGLEGGKNLRLGQEAYFWGEKLGSVLFQFKVSCFEEYVLSSTMFSIFRCMAEHWEDTGEHLSFYLLQIPLPILYLISGLQVSRHSSWWQGILNQLLRSKSTKMSLEKVRGTLKWSCPSWCNWYVVSVWKVRNWSRALWGLGKLI